MDKEKFELKDKVLTLIDKYLGLCGWTFDLGQKDDSIFGYYLDPIHGQKHRSDMAWFIQTERDLAEIREKYKTKT